MYERLLTYFSESIPTKPTVSLVIAVFGLMLIGAVVPSTPAQSAGELDLGVSYTTLLAQADREGSVRVIVELDVDELSQTASLDQALVSIQREHVRSAHTRVLDRLRHHLVRRHRTFDQLPYVALTLDSDALAATAADPEVIAIHEDRFLRSTLADSTVLIGATEAVAWGYSGAGQTVALLDTGVDASHPFLAGRIVHQACFSSDAPAFGISTLCPNGATIQIGGMAARPCAVTGCFHGTHMAGIVAGDGEDFSGVAPEAGILAIQVASRVVGPRCTEFGLSSPCILSTTSDLMAALEYVYHRRNTFDIAAVNISAGDEGHYTTPCDNHPLRWVINLLRAEGIATVISAGNQGYTTAVSAPACISSAISVGATTKSDKICEFSNSAPVLDLLAPGSRIRSSIPGGGFATFSGTSVAAPHVAGAFAVLRSAVSEASTDEILGVLQTEGEPIRDPANGLTRPRIQVDLAAEELIAEKMPPTIYSLTADRAPPQIVNTKITFTAKASGGTGTYDYRWWIVNGTTRYSAGKWQRGRNTFTWTPTSPSPDYKIVVWARSNGQTTGLPRGKAAMQYPINAP